MAVRARVDVKTDPANWTRSGVAWAVILIAGPLLCGLADLMMHLALKQWPTSTLPYADLVLKLCVINAALAVSLQLINGYTGQFSLGHAGFMAVGAYADAVLMVYVQPHIMGENPGMIAGGIYFAFALVGCGLVAAAFGLLVGIPSLRLKGDYLAIVTLGFGEIIRVVLLNTESLGGARGFTDLEQLDHGLFWCLLLLLATTVVTRNLVNSTRGLAFRAVGEDEIAAEAIGVNTTRYKVSAFVIGAFFAGVAGGVYASVQAYINPGIFDFVKSMEVVAMVVLGGLGSLPGAMIAAVGLTLLPEVLRGGFMPQAIHDVIPQAVWTALPNWRMVIYSLILIGAMLVQAKTAGRKKTDKNKKKPVEAAA